MAIDPLNITPQSAFSSFDFSPLAKLGQQYQQQQQAQQLASLGPLYGALPADPQATPNVGGAPPGAPTATRAPFSNSTDLMANYGNSISGIESGGRYNLLGPTTKTGDRAIGKYQVMASNVPEWTRAALGRPMTADEFRNDPAAQDAVFRHRFGGYVQKYGPEGAAKAWFAGEGGMNNPNATDQLGTSVSSYGRRFMQGLE